MSSLIPPLVYLVHDATGGRSAYATEEAAYAAIGRRAVTDGIKPQDVNVLPTRVHGWLPGGQLAPVAVPARPAWLAGMRFVATNRYVRTDEDRDISRIYGDDLTEVQDAELAAYIVSLLNAHADGGHA